MQEGIGRVLREVQGLQQGLCHLSIVQSPHLGEVVVSLGLSGTEVDVFPLLVGLLGLYQYKKRSQLTCFYCLK
jgi:hypothetical protein